jgi:BON domain
MSWVQAPKQCIFLGAAIAASPLVLSSVMMPTWAIATLDPPPAIAQRLNIKDVSKTIKSSLTQDVTLRRFDLDINPDGNTLVLTGIVQTEAQKRLAEQIARQAAIGFQVVNQIVVQPDFQPIRGASR